MNNQTQASGAFRGGLRRLLGFCFPKGRKGMATKPANKAAAKPAAKTYKVLKTFNLAPTDCKNRNPGDKIKASELDAATIAQLLESGAIE